MVSIRADENRYLATAAARDEALLRRIPGSRHNGSRNAIQMPRQPGTVLALDALFGPEGWEHAADLDIEVVEARRRGTTEPTGEAKVELTGNELSIECLFGDKELVKLVPGYRWSAPQRRWFLPAQPMALEMLRAYFGEHLEVSEDAAAYIALRAVDEQAAVDLASRKAPESAPPALPLVADVIEQAVSVAAEADAPSSPALLVRLDRLTTAVEELVGLLRGQVPSLIQVDPVDPGEEQPASPDTGDGWRELITRLDSDPGEAREQALRLAQTAVHEEEPAYRTVAGLAMARLGQHAEALTALRRPLERPAVIDDDLEREASKTYVGAVLSLLRAESGPEGTLESDADFRNRLLDELVNDNGFEDEQLSSEQARSRLDYLVNDPVLRRIAPALSDYARIAHMLGFARGGQWMAATRITDILREKTLGDEGFALALIHLANALNGEKCVNGWDKAWPHGDVAETLQDLSWLVGEAERRLKNPSLDAEMVEAAALSCLACIAGGPAEWASNAQRRGLVQLISLRHPSRREYAEFLAAFQPAASGNKSILGLFPGWTKVLAQTRLGRSAPYLTDVAANDNGGSGSLTWALAEDVYLQALGLWGIDDAQSELVDLLDLLEGGKRPDNYLNEAGRLVEDSDSAWSARVSREQRKALYRRALEASLRQGHNRDTIEAFDRYIRELRDEGAPAQDEILSTCVRLSTAMRAARGPALEVLLGLQLETGLPFEQTAEQLLNLRGDYEDAGLALAGMLHLYPAFRTWWEESNPVEIDLDRSTDGIPGLRVLIVGGHKWLEHRVKPVLEDEWQLKVTWLDPGQAQRGPAGIEKAKTADLVIVNAACIGHSASGRIGDAAKNAGVPLVTHHLRGAGTLLARLAQELHSRRPAA